ncbi:YqaJ viral recombinase family protein [Bradyrhizobium erythrophlei]|uniref:Phage-related protein, predicted endonuclease n=1 Tax=Bradyrhizobium erythrophlei TaxID=1437360 RepID=A0A1M5PP52_9BRAD|nr:YqaJ viral recombinase family protein [Bradyrhizobium erythrophlei]SHH03532.1 Phage-related protein, predicted endonuclease [Bradyrhizobium erythrophlei]
MQPSLYRRTGHIGMSAEARNARRASIGGSDAKIIMSGDQDAIERLWAEKRGEIAPEDLSEVILINLGNLTEPLNADLFEKDTGWWVTNEQDKVFYEDWDKAHATLDGLVRTTESGKPFAMVEFKFMFPFGFSIDNAVTKYFPQCQHNMMVTGLPSSYLSILTGAAQWYRVEIEADIFYQVELLKAEKAFWDCVETGKTPGNPTIEVPLIERVKVIDMNESNEWGEQAAVLLQTLTASKKHDAAKKAIKKLMPEDAMQAAGKGVTIKLSKDGKLLIDCDKDEVAKIDEQQAWFPPAPKKKRATKKKAADNDNTEAAEAA